MATFKRIYLETEFKKLRNNKYIIVTIQVALTRLHIFPRSEEKLDIK